MKVDVEPFRERALELTNNGRSWSGLAKRMGWLHPSGCGDASRMQRTVGLKRWRGAGPSKHIQYDTALKLCSALELDPVEVGL